MKTLEQQVQELTDREEIKELTARYAHEVTHGEGAKVAELQVLPLTISNMLYAIRCKL